MAYTTFARNAGWRGGGEEAGEGRSIGYGCNTEHRDGGNLVGGDGK